MHSINPNGEPVWQQQLRLECISEQTDTTEDMDTEFGQPADKPADELAAATAKPNQLCRYCDTAM